MFQWAPTLGGECYWYGANIPLHVVGARFNGHPPLGVNATRKYAGATAAAMIQFQWAPTLGGECYHLKNP